jgi:hypothetical protein
MGFPLFAVASGERIAVPDAPCVDRTAFAAMGAMRTGKLPRYRTEYLARGLVNPSHA